MPNTCGFETVAEIKESVLLEFLRGAYDNGGTSDPGSIPHEVPIPAGTALGPYVATGGQVAILESGLGLEMAPTDNGVTVQLGTDIQVNLDTATTHLDSMALLQMQANISITAPFGVIAGSEPNIGVIFDGLPRNRVAVSLTSGNPLTAITLDLIKEYIHDLYVDGTIPHTQTFEDQSYGTITFDAFVEIFDDQNDPNRAIEVTLPDATHVRLSLPIHVRLSGLGGFPNIGMVDPMGVKARLILNVPYERTDSQIVAQLSDAEVSVEGLAAADDVTEAAHYNLAKTMNSGIDALFTEQIQERGQALVAALSDMVIATPTTAQIETLIGDKVHEELLNRHYIGAWTPNMPEGSPVTVNEARPKALDDALAIAINPAAGADESLLGDFVPSGADFAVGLDHVFVENTIGEIMKLPEPKGLGGIPGQDGFVKNFPDLEGYSVDVTSLTWDLQDGKIHFDGACTVYDVFCGADADCTFWADIGLRWSAPDASGAQQLEPYLIDSDASLPWWAWLLAILTIIFTLIIGIIWLVITIVIDNIADAVGAAVITDELSGKVQMIGAWPQQLQGIGTVRSTFDTDVIIEPSGLIFKGSILVTAQYALTVRSPANPNGPYWSFATSPLLLQAGSSLASISHNWKLGDGASGSGYQLNHTYIENGLYVVKLATQVNEPGGALTHRSTLVRVKNVKPTVDAGPDISIKEGQTFTVTGRFEDPEWVDKHEAIWDFGDKTLPVAGLLTETNTQPAAKGTVVASHAYCNNGVYTATLRVRDDDGGVGEDTLTVRVVNVPPKVATDGTVFAYPDVPITLVASFVDPGWCDTHTAYWKFGDGDFALPPTPAVVKEVHEPPAGYGIAAATHHYHELATHLAECVVIDSDNARGRAQLKVIVVDLMNKDFEAGFHNLPVGAVANEWVAYVAGKAGLDANIAATTASPGGQIFDAEEYVVRDGQRSQRLQLGPGMRAGLYQSVGANPGWDYQVILHYHIDGRCAGRCRLGIDPKGGHDPEAPSVVWSKGEQVGHWHKLLTRINAEARRITVFLEGEALTQRTFCYFDAVVFEPFPCKLPDPQKPELPQEPTRQCVDWADEREAHTVPSPYQKDGFTFNLLGKGPLRIVLWGEPQGAGKLALDEKGVAVALPFVADEVLADVVSYTSKPIVLRALDDKGQELGQAALPSPVEQIPQVLTVKAAGIAGVEVSGGGREGLLIRLCAVAFPAGSNDGATPGIAPKTPNITKRVQPCGCNGKNNKDEREF